MRTLTPEYRAKISASLKGRPKSEETRARISAAKMGHAVSPETRSKLAAGKIGNRHVREAAVKGECAYCGASAQTLDHVVPARRGGTEVVPACFCNGSKGARTPEEWLEAGLYGSARTYRPY